MNLEKIKKPKLTTFQLIVLLYFLAALISTILLSIPFFHNPGAELSIIDATFTAVSAISVTGLTVVSIADTFNTLGQFVLAFILQFGGIGIMTLGTAVWLILGKKIGLKERRLIMTDQNQLSLTGLVALIKNILYLILTIEAIGTAILGTYFLKYFPTWQEAYFQGFFAAVSATTNAGFDITGQSLIPFADDYFVQTVTMILLILGAIGFPVLIEVKDFITGLGKRRHHFSLFAKITTTTYFVLIVVGTLSILLLEKNHFFLDKSWHEALFYSLFQSVSSRNGGLATMNIADFSTPTQLVLSILMFIGASPSSVGGGIRTTTFAVVSLTIYNYARGRNTIKIFKREIDPEDIIRSFIVVTTAIFINALAIIVLAYTEPFTVMEILLEVTSAFGTTGFSTGITPYLSTFGKSVIILLMFIGRIGIFSFLFLIRDKSNKDLYHYPKEKIIVG